MRAEVISKPEELMALQQEWTCLLEGSIQDGVFLTWDWIAAWWKTYAPLLGATLCVITCRTRSGELCGIAPLYIAQTRGGGLLGNLLQGRVIRFMGAGGDTSPDYLNVIARPGLEEEVASATIEQLANGDGPGWDALLLSDMPAEAAMTRALERTMRDRLGLPSGVYRQANSVCPYVELPGSADDLLARLSRKHRYNLQRSRQKLEREHHARFFLWDDPAGAEAGIELLARLHRRRFTAKGEAHSFSSDAYGSFHKDVAERFRRRGMLRLYCLEADGAVVAMLYCFRYRDQIYHFQSGFDPDLSRLSIGQVLVMCALEHAIEEGARRFDFLKGEYAYKSHWATHQRETQRLIAGRLNLGGLHHLYQSVLRPTLGRLIRGDF